MALNDGSPASQGLKDNLKTKGRKQRTNQTRAHEAERRTAGAPVRNDLTPKLEFVDRQIDELKAPQREVRKLEPGHITEVAASIGALGFSHPILIAPDGTILDGVIRHAAAKALGIKTVPCVVLNHLTAATQRAARIAFNRLGERGSWNADELRLEIEELIELDAPIEILATSIGGVVTGIGADLLVIDDPMKAAEAASLVERESVFNWFKGSMMSRFDKPAQSGVIVVMQRLHQDDLIGRLLTEEGWTYLKLPGEAQERITVPLPDDFEWILEPGDLLFRKRFNAQALAQLKNDLGESAYNAQILQAPAPPGGALIKLKWFQRYQALPPKTQIEMVVQVWDTAMVDSPTADYSACTTWAISGKRLFLMDTFRERMPYHQLEKAVFEQKAKHSATYVLVEKAGTGIVLYQNIRQLQGLTWLDAIKPDVSKMERIEQQVPKIQRKRVFLPVSAPWLGRFEEEVAEFPHGRHDDQVDSMAYFLKVFDFGRVQMLRDLSMFSGWTPGQPVL